VDNDRNIVEGTAQRQGRQGTRRRLQPQKGERRAQNGNPWHLIFFCEIFAPSCG
jgi:hypothetical protein